jgi:hypothetical protein
MKQSANVMRSATRRIERADFAVRQPSSLRVAGSGARRHTAIASERREPVGTSLTGFLRSLRLTVRHMANPTIVK